MVTPPSDSELRDALETVLSEAGIEAPGEIRRRPSAYRTSFPLEELDLTLVDGASLHLVFKQLDWGTLSDEARLAKPEFLHDPRREPAVYASVLAPALLGPRYYGSVIDPERGRHWLFIEWIDGRELFQVGDLQLWAAAAAWLGAMHMRLSDELDRHLASGHLLDHDRAHYRRWIERATSFARASGEPQSRALSLDWLAARYEPAIEEFLLEMPRTVIHGEFYASNVLVAGDASNHRVCPVDWELAAAAPGLIDLAALISGGWSDGDREAIVSAYRATAGPGSFSARQLDLARLHLAVQWLGWAEPSWNPPAGQQQDWLGEALALAERLAL